jgi:hypothetical protein
VALFFTYVGDCCLVLTGILGVSWFALSLHRSLISSIIVASLTCYVVCALAVLSIHPISVVRANALNSVADMISNCAQVRFTTDAHPRTRLLKPTKHEYSLLFTSILISFR